MTTGQGVCWAMFVAAKQDAQTSPPWLGTGLGKWNLMLTILATKHARDRHDDKRVASTNSSLLVRVQTRIKQHIKHNVVIGRVKGTIRHRVQLHRTRAVPPSTAILKITCCRLARGGNETARYQTG